MIYTTCKYAPEELFAGFGEPVERLDPNPASFSCADGCSHPNLCGFAKAVIEEVCARDIQALVFTDCCDAMRRAFDVLRQRDMRFLYFLPLPHKTGDAEVGLFAAELEALARAWSAHSGTAFSWREALAACAAREHAGPKEQAEVSLIGAHGGSMLLGRLRETFPDMSVWDATCSGNRCFSGGGSGAESVGSEKEFFRWYAGRLLRDLPPCMRMQTASAPFVPEGSLGSRGTVFHTIKFCDYYSFAYPAVQNAVTAPLLKIETDTTPQSSGQLGTRLGAFAETIRGGKRQEGPSAARKEGAPVLTAGIDSGSTSTDAVVMNERRELLGSAILPTGMSASASAREALAAALRAAGAQEEDLAAVVSTGYGRDIVQMGGSSVTEITCHARGARYLFPQARTVIDIGGQDSKVIRIDERGAVTNFIMNDKCAAGTGRFLEMLARALGLGMEEMAGIGLVWKQDIQISSMCTVFAESEVVSLVARDADIADIVHGLNASVAAKTVSLVHRCKGVPEYAMTGGVSRNAGVVRCLEEQLGARLLIAEESQLCGAIGAALIGLEGFGA